MSHLFSELSGSSRSGIPNHLCLQDFNTHNRCSCHSALLQIIKIHIPVWFLSCFLFTIFLHALVTQSGNIKWHSFSHYNNTSNVNANTNETVEIGEINLTEIYPLHLQQLLASITFICTFIVQVFHFFFFFLPCQRASASSSYSHFHSGIQISLSAETLQIEDYVVRMLTIMVVTVL